MMASLMTRKDTTHLGFSDESHWNTGRYRSLGLVTLTSENRNDLTVAVQHILDNSGTKEFAWKNLRDVKYSFAAEKLCDFVNRTVGGEMRVDVLTWDVEDSRHRIYGRDDTANLARMYYHLMTSAITRRWPSGAVWQMHPDERTDMDWDELERCLRGVPRKLKSHAQARLDGEAETSKLNKPRIDPVKSSSEPLVQLADLFAGIAAFSWNRSAAYDRWEAREDGQTDMFDDILDAAQPLAISKSESYKARTLQRFDAFWLRAGGIHHDYGEGLRTWKPDVPVNFWLYIPQGDNDKAPRRGDRPSVPRSRR